MFNASPALAPGSLICQTLKIKSKYSVEEIFHALKVFSKIKENDRLFTHKNSVYITTQNQKFQWFWRWYYEENRYRNITYVSTVIKAAFVIAEDALAKQHEIRLTVSPPHTQALQLFKNNQFILRIRSNITDSVTGILNLKRTYSDDNSISAHLDILAEEIADFFQQYDISLKYFDTFNSADSQSSIASADDANFQQNPYQYPAEDQQP